MHFFMLFCVLILAQFVFVVFYSLSLPVGNFLTLKNMQFFYQKRAKITKHAESFGLKGKSETTLGIIKNSMKNQIFFQQKL